MNFSADAIESIHIPVEGADDWRFGGQSWRPLCRSEFRDAELQAARP